MNDCYYIRGKRYTVKDSRKVWEKRTYLPAMVESLTVTERGVFVHQTTMGEEKEAVVSVEILTRDRAADIMNEYSAYIIKPAYDRIFGKPPEGTPDDIAQDAENGH